MSSTSTPRPDRRHLRRAQTIEQVLDISVQLMAEHGVAGLSLGEVARSMGIRPPSLYGYFSSKNAIYDAVFARGWREITQTMEALPDPDDATEPKRYLLESAELFVRWAVEHPVHTQLMGWRPVPGYQPSEDAYEPAVASLARGRSVMTRLQGLGHLDLEADPDELMRMWTVLLSGVITQQLANAPGEPFEKGSFTALLPDVVEMFRTRYAPPPSHPTQDTTQPDDRRPEEIAMPANVPKNSRVRPVATRSDG